MSPSRILIIVLAATLWAFAAACQLGDGSCLRMSDCDEGYACVEGTCRSDLASDAPKPVPGKSAEPAIGDASSSVDAASLADATNADVTNADVTNADGSTDAATDP